MDLKPYRWGVVFAATSFLLQSGLEKKSFAANEPVTQEQFKAWTDWTKKSVHALFERQKRVEAGQPTPGASGTPAAAAADSGGEQAIDLGAGSSQAALSTGSSESSVRNGPKFTTYFDLNFINQPGTNDSLAFDNYHTFLFFDIAPTPDLTFSFNLLGPQTFPIYYELDYQASKTVTLRAGKIWIPFDDLSPQSPHNIFGGRAGIQQLMPATTGNNGNLLLPSVWTELGVGAKWMIVDKTSLQLEGHLCLINGFTDGGTDPVTGSHDYPNFTEYSPATQSSSGNHRDKSIAARLHGLFFNQFGLGASYYTGQWNQDSDPAGHLRLSMIGVDSQLRLGPLELRGGVVSMKVDLPGTSANRGGTYGEVGLPFAQRRWKILGRVGTLQLDDRVALPTDETILGGTLLYNPGRVQFSIEHSRDLRTPGVSVGFVSYTNLRMIVVF